MERHERDLTYFELLLEGERDPHRRRLILQQIRDVKRQILELLTAQRAQVQRENALFQMALDQIEDAENKKK